jgi:hypothetical protein
MIDAGACSALKKPLSRDSFRAIILTKLNKELRGSRKSGGRQFDENMAVSAPADMNRNCIKSFLFWLVVCLLAPLSIQAGEGDQAPTYSFTEQELDDLLAPIALYPDPLLAEMLPASTYPTEIADAAAWLESGGETSKIDEQSWDESVKAVAHYPEILALMDEDMDWTASLGDAFLNQPEDVTRSIQRLRAQARAAGNLVSTNEQRVNIEDDYIQIVPAEPEYIYVPEYAPSDVYTGGAGPRRRAFNYLWPYSYGRGLAGHGL